MTISDLTRTALEEARAALTYALGRVTAALAAVPTDSTLLARGKTPAAIVLCIQQAGVPMSPVQVHAALTTAGRDVTPAAVHQACYRLAKQGALRRVGRGLYGLLE